ncbi:MAG: hypothetical protein EXS13_12325 [Planctomycetes bacterium]|nr:hypothetical protein [Planctomycetota bacterium]
MLEPLFFLALAVLTPGVPSLQPPPLALHVDAIIQPDGAIGPGGWIVLRNGRIESIGPAEPPVGCARLEFAGGVAAPGFVDVDTSLGAAGQLSEPARPFTPEVATGDALEPDHSSFLAAARSGVTTVGLMPGGRNIIDGRVAIVRTADDDGRGAQLCGHGPLRYTLSAQAFDGSRVPTSRMGALPQLREMLAKSPAPSSGTSLVAADTADEIRIVIDTFGGAGRSFALLHPTRADDAIELVRGSVSGRPTAAVIGPFDLDTGERDVRVAKLLADGGVAVAFSGGGDGGSLRLTAAVATRSGFDAKAARTGLSLAGARLLGIESEAGTIEAGKRADLVVLDGDPLDLAAKVKLVLVGGAPVEAAKESP